MRSEQRLITVQRTRPGSGRHHGDDAALREQDVRYITTVLAGHLRRHPGEHGSGELLDSVATDEASKPKPAPHMIFRRWAVARTGAPGGRRGDTSWTASPDAMRGGTVIGVLSGTTAAQLERVPHNFILTRRHGP